MTKRHIAPALLALSALIIAGCSLVKPTISPVPVAALPAPAATEDPKAAALKEARIFVLHTAKRLPVWQSDDLGRFERPQLADISDDLQLCYQDQDPDVFIADTLLLARDVERLVALSEMLQQNGIV